MKEVIRFYPLLCFSPLFSFHSCDYGVLSNKMLQCLCTVWVHVCVYTAYLGGCTGRHRPSSRCMDANWSEHADQETHTHFRGRAVSATAGLPLPPVPLSRSPSAVPLESQRRSGPATHLAPWRRNGQVTHELSTSFIYSPSDSRKTDTTGESTHPHPHTYSRTKKT